jgi:hypothetical protein
MKLLKEKKTERKKGNDVEISSEPLNIFHDEIWKIDFVFIIISISYFQINRRKIELK